MMEQWVKDTIGDAPENKELVEYVTAKGYKTPADAIKAGHEAHKLNTRKTEELKAEVEKQFIPSDDWKEDQWKAFSDRTRPKDKAEYKYEVPEALKPYMKPEKMAAIIDEIHNSGVPAPIANRILKKYLEGEAESAAAIVAATEKAKAEDKAALEKDWGVNFKQNEELAKRGQGFAAKAAGMEEEPFNKLLSDYGMDTHPAFKKLFKWVGEMSNDPKFVMGNPTLKATPEKTTGQLLVEQARNPSQSAA